MDITVRSSAFNAGEPIPKKYSQDGENVSPPLSFNDVPSEAKELALICDDPDAPMAQPFVHWVIYKIPATVDGLPEGVRPAPRPDTPSGAIQGENSVGKTGYVGPAPPPGHGTHHYHFKLYALNAELDLQPGATKAELLEAMEGHILAQGELVGTYER